MGNMLDQYANDEDDGDQIDPDPIYIDKQQPGEYIFEVYDLSLLTHHDGHKYPEEDFFVAELKVVEQIIGQADLSQEGAIGSIKIELTDKQGKHARKNSFKDLAALFAAITGETQAYFLKKPEGPGRIYDVIDNSEDYEGTKIRYTARNEKDGWYNPTITPVEGDDVDE